MSPRRHKSAQEKRAHALMKEKRLACPSTWPLVTSAPTKIYRHLIKPHRSRLSPEARGEIFAPHLYPWGQRNVDKSCNTALPLTISLAQYLDAGIISLVPHLDGLIERNDFSSETSQGLRDGLVTMVEVYVKTPLWHVHKPPLSYAHINALKALYGNIAVLKEMIFRIVGIEGSFCYPMLGLRERVGLAREAKESIDGLLSFKF